MSIVWFSDAKARRFGVQIDDLRVIRTMPGYEGGTILKYADGQEIELPTVGVSEIEAAILSQKSVRSLGRSDELLNLCCDVYDQFVNECCEIGVNEWSPDHKLSHAFWRWVMAKMPFYKFSVSDYKPFHAWLDSRFEASHDGYGAVEYYGIRVNLRNAERLRNEQPK